MALGFTFDPILKVGVANLNLQTCNFKLYSTGNW